MIEEDPTADKYPDKHPDRESAKYLEECFKNKITKNRMHKSKIDYNIYNNRLTLTQEISNQSEFLLGLMFLKLLTYMEIGEHKDRQEFWEFIEKLVIEKRDFFKTIDAKFDDMQLSLIQEDTKQRNKQQEKQQARIIELPLDKKNK